MNGLDKKLCPICVIEHYEKGLKFDDDEPHNYWRGLAEFKVCELHKNVTGAIFRQNEAKEILRKAWLGILY